MAKFRGKIGYVRTEETAPGSYTEVVEERTYSGDILRNNRRWEDSGQVNDNLTINNQISIISDSFSTENLSNMRYVELMGSLWKITNVEIQRPRLILTIGDVYHGA